VIGLVQRVAQARVEVEGRTVGRIEHGMLVFVGVVPADDAAASDRLLKRLLQYRMFDDAAGKMNLNLAQVGGGLLLVSQFTLAADTDKGLRPSFSTAAPPPQARALFETLVQAARTQHDPVQSGVFGANMQVSLVNDGPVTFWLES
jgi:D-tyrosyl-tRNA(Tyr) deacylase